MHSYRLELSRGLEVDNIITAIMEEYHLDQQQALYWLSGYASKTISNFLANIRALPSWGEKIDRAVMVYIDRVARCVRGYDAWSYETNRHYGNESDGLQHYSHLYGIAKKKKSCVRQKAAMDPEKIY